MYAEKLEEADAVLYYTESRNLSYTNRSLNTQSNMRCGYVDIGAISLYWFCSTVFV